MTTPNAGDAPPVDDAPPPHNEVPPGPDDDMADPDHPSHQDVEWGDLDEDELMLATLERNDTGNAKRLVHRHGDDLVYVDRVGWHSWNGKIWDREDGPIEVQRRAIDAAQQIQGPETEALEQYLLRKLPPDTENLADKAEEIAMKHRGFGIASGNLNRMTSMIQVAKVDLQRPPDTMDADPFLLSVANGTLTLPNPAKPPSDVDPVAKRQFSRGDYISRQAKVVFDPSIECPQWLKFLNAVQPDPDMQRFLQTYMGYCLTGLTTEQVLVVNYGGGANGKSTFIETVANVMGGYAASVPIETFMMDKRRGGGDTTPDLVRLPGVRLLRAAEPEVGSRLSESLVKIITGGEEIAARDLWEKQFTYRPHFKLVLSCNHKPNIYGTDDGIWRRILLIPWETTIPKHERDPALPEKLLGEAPGIFNWLLDGARMWADGGLHIPPGVRAATDEYRQDSDPVGQFLEICTEKAPGEDVKSIELFEVYERYCRANAVPPVTQRGFNKALQAKGFIRKKSSTMLWKGIKITDWMMTQDGADTPSADSISGHVDQGGYSNDEPY